MFAAMAGSGAFLGVWVTRNPAAKVAKDRLVGAVGRKRNRNKLRDPAAAEIGRTDFERYSIRQVGIKSTFSRINK